MDEDPLNSEVDLIPIEGQVAVVGDAAYFGYQTRGYMETGDPSQMAIGIGPVHVDLVTGECRMLGSLEAMDRDLFEVDELGPGGWRRVLPEMVDPWRATFDAEPALASLMGACPPRGAQDLRRWYQVDDPLDDTFNGVRAVAYGWLVEWCASCHLCREDSDTFVPEFWRSPYDVPEAYEMKFSPRHVEAARQAQLRAESARNG